MTPRLRAALENEMLLWPTRTEGGRSIQEQNRWEEALFCRHLTEFLFWTTQTFTSEMQASVVCERVKASEGESDLYSSVSSANIWWETRVVTDYIRKRLSIQNEENWSQDGTLGHPTGQKWRRGSYSIHNYYLCPVMQVGTEERQSKITNTKSAFEASQKNVMIDCVEGSA